MSKRYVYVVDDEEAIRRSLRLMLTVEGYAVTLFDSGVSLIDAIEGLVPGSLLLDLRMPGKDGLEVQQEINARGIGLPTVVMTGHGDLSVAIAALRHGAVAFLEKPFTRLAAAEALATAFLKLEQPDVYARRLTEAAQSVSRLAEEERTLLGYLAAGRNHETIAADLSLSPADLEDFRLRILSKLEVGDIKDAIGIALAAGLDRDL
jgi:two-component system response regulator FixJ